MAFVTKSRSQGSPRFLQTLVSMLGGMVLFFVAVGAVSSGYQILFSGRVFPGISMAGVDLSSLTPEQASITLNQHLTFPINGRIVFRDGDHVWVARPIELGMVFDAGTSVQRAYQLGRQAGLLNDMATQLNAWQVGMELPPVIIFDARVAHQYLENIAAQIDQPVRETDLHLDGATIVYVPGQIGRQVNIDKALSALLVQLQKFQDGEIPLDIEEKPPVITDASAQADILKQALSAPITLHISGAQTGDPGPWTLSPSLIPDILKVARVKEGSGWQYQISIDGHGIEQFLGQIAPKVNKESNNPRFYFDDAAHQLVLVQSASAGRTLDIPATRDELEQKLLQGEHDIPLVLKVVNPDVQDNATAGSLGISGLVQSYTSYFRGSSSERLQNIKAASARFYGLLVPPKTTFSMGSAIGDISLDNGYAEALIIYNGQTIRGVGGGVCQVSTTLFRTAFYAGYPIIERHAHAYRVLYYEQTATSLNPQLAGIDATVYFPLVDLKFTNDRPYWLLMETYFNSSDFSLTWKFYSGDDGRSVNVQNLGLQNVTPAPDPKFVENPDLPRGTCKQVDYSADGADITVVRSVTLNGQHISLPGDTIRTQYEPWQAVYQYGPGTDNPQSLASSGQCH